MNLLPSEILRHIFSYTNCTTQVALKLSCLLFNDTIGEVKYTKNCIFAELCCLEGNLSMLKFATSNQPLLGRYYESAIKGQSLEVLEYLYNCIKPPNNTVYLAAVHGNESVYRYARDNFLNCDLTYVGTVPHPYIPMAEVTNNQLMIEKALENGNIEYLKLLNANRIPLRSHANTFIRKYSDDIRKKETVYWLIDKYGCCYDCYKIDYPKLFRETEFDLIRCLSNGSVNLISWRYDIHVALDMSLSEIISLLPENAYKDCGTTYGFINHFDWEILMYCEKHGISIWRLDYEHYSPYIKREITIEGLECIKRLHPKTFKSGWMAAEMNFLSVNFKLVKDWLTSTFPGRYDYIFFYTILLCGLIEEMYVNEEYTFDYIIQNSSHIKIWDFAYQNYTPTKCAGNSLKQIVWLKNHGLLDVKRTIANYSLGDKKRIINWIS